MKQTTPTARCKIKQKWVETGNLFEDNWCKPLLSFIARKDKHYRNFKHLFFTVPSLISSKEPWSPPGKGHPVASPAASQSAIFIPFSLFCTRRCLFLLDPNRKGTHTFKTDNYLLIQSQVRWQGVTKPNVPSDDGEHVIVGWALVGAQLHVPVHFSSTQLTVQVHSPLTRREGESLTSWVNPWPSCFSTYPMFPQQTLSWHQECQRSQRCGHPVLLPGESPKHREADIVFLSQTSPLSPSVMRATAPCHTG